MKKTIVIIFVLVALMTIGCKKQLSAVCVGDVMDEELELLVKDIEEDYFISTETKGYLADLNSDGMYEYYFPWLTPCGIDEYGISSFDYATGECKEICSARYHSYDVHLYDGQLYAMLNYNVYVGSRAEEAFELEFDGSEYTLSDVDEYTVAIILNEVNGGLMTKSIENATEDELKAMGDGISIIENSEYTKGYLADLNEDNAYEIYYEALAITGAYYTSVCCYDPITGERHIVWDFENANYFLYLYNGELYILEAPAQCFCSDACRIHKIEYAYDHFVIQGIDKELEPKILGKAVADCSD